MNDLEVFIDHAGQTIRVGDLHLHVRAGQESSSFRYTENWLKLPSAFAIQPDMPLSLNTYHVASNHNVLPSCIRDTGPDRWGRKLITRSAEKSGSTQPISEIDYLVAIDDRTRIGALRYRIEGNSFLKGSSDRQVPPLLTLPMLLNAADAVGKGGETAADLNYLLGYGSPLGGARPKSAVIGNEGRLAIAKFPSLNDQRNIAAGEVLLSKLALEAGITASKTELYRLADRSISLVSRFDRDHNGNRNHFISAMTMLGAKEGEEGTYTDIALAIRRFGVEPKKDMLEIFRRATFNVLTSNFDDHLRNHGFLYVTGGKWRLSPAYDMNPVPITEKSRILTTWISEAGPEASIDRLLEASKFFGLNLNEAKRTIKDIASATSKWYNFGQMIHLRKTELAPYETAFEHKELKIALTLEPSPISIPAQK